MNEEQRNFSVTQSVPVASPFAWRSQPADKSFHKQDDNHRRQMDAARAAWARGKQGDFTVMPIHQANHGGAYSKVRAG